MWARYAKSRFTLGKNGSPAWNAISHLIDGSFQYVSWKFGSGNTSVKEVCNKLGVTAPYYLRREKFRDVFDSAGQLNSLLAYIPTREQDNIRNTIFSNGEDQIVWNLSSDGLFSTKIFFESFQMKIPNLKWAKGIWTPWIPPKVSTFLWKIFKGIVATDENIRRIGIPGVSRCVCCKNPNCEDSDHLFFWSDWSMAAWKYMSLMFNRPLIHSLAALQRVWFREGPKDFMESLASGLASITIWEIWKARNNMIYNSRKADLKRIIKSWAPRIANNIHYPFNPTKQNIHTLEALNISPPRLRPSRHTWSCWRPPEWGLALNIAFGTIQGIEHGVFLIRDTKGCIIGGRKTRTYHNKTLDQIESILQMAAHFFRDVYHQISICQGTHSDFRYLTDQEDKIPHEAIYTRRKILNQHRFLFRKIDPATNNAACAALYTMPCGSFTSCSEHSKALRLAITADIEHIPSGPRQNNITSSPILSTNDDIQVLYT